MLTVTAGQTSAVVQAATETDQIIVIPKTATSKGYAEVSWDNVAWTQWRPGWTMSEARMTAGSNQGKLPYVRFVCVSGSIDCDVIQQQFGGDQAVIDAVNATAMTPAQVTAKLTKLPISNSIVVLGDSITENGMNTTNLSTRREYNGRAWYAIAAARLSQRFYISNVAGVSGNKTSDMLARFDTDVAPYSPGWVILESGTNDISTGITGKQLFDTIQKIFAKCSAIGAKLVVTLTVRANFGTNAMTAEYNTCASLLRAAARTTPGFFFVPFMQYITDWTTQNTARYGTPAAGKLVDSDHPSSATAHLMSNAIVDFFNAYGGPTGHTPQTSHYGAGVGDTYNAVINGHMVQGAGGTVGTGNTGTIPEVWIASRTGTITADFSIATRPDYIGNWLVATVSGSTAATDTLLITQSGDFTTENLFKVGDQVFAEIDIDASCSSGTFVKLEYEIQIQNASFATLITTAANCLPTSGSTPLDTTLGIAALQNASGVPVRLRTPAITIPTAGTKFYLVVRVITSSGGAAVVKLGAAELRKANL